MYRQVKIVPEQWNLQRIFWRENPNHKLKEYHLIVVTYGLASSPYLAVRAMQEGARAMKKDHPEAVNTIINDFYMDDAITGAENEENAIKLAKEMQAVLANSGFDLCKWRSNNANLITELSDEKTSDIIFTEQGQTSVLGLKWLTKTDEFTYIVTCSEIGDKLTKRIIVSKIGQLYDPIGFLEPVIVKAKLLVQSLWKEQLDWDQEIADSIKIQWQALWEPIKLVEQVKIPRWLKIHQRVQYQLHGFADSSMIAYGCAIYVRIIDENGQISCHLITAKSRVAPLKKVTIPRLELTAAELLSKLFHLVRTSMEWENVPYFLWSDSTIALQWINKEIHELKMFVANRVKKIRELSQVKNWYHVRTDENPADLISRGISAGDIVQNNLWWNGPSWLKKPQENWPKPVDIHSVKMPPEFMIELKVHSISIKKSNLQISQEINDEQPVSIDLIDYTNDLRKLMRITSYVMRFCARLREQKEHEKPPSVIDLKQVKTLVKLPNIQEKASALRYFIRKEQEQSFSNEYRALKEAKDNFPNGKEKYINLPERSKLLPLHPFMDDANLMRVGGRIGSAEISYDMKHPLIVPNGTRISWQIINDAHSATVHGSVQVMMQYIRRQFWIPKLRNELRAFLHKCVVCARYNKKLETQLMGNLPKDRVNQNRAFLVTGVDYAGPIEIAERYRSRMHKSKCWIAIFVCMTTRAVHIDVVTDLSAAAFIACFERFVARRGHCNRLYSDNGTTYVGTNKELKLAFKNWHAPEGIEHLNKKGTEWVFMTPAAPHQGGIYEAAVKSTKYHLRRMLGAKCYTYEHLITLLTQIEAVLNSSTSAFFNWRANYFAATNFCASANK